MKPSITMLELQVSLPSGAACSISNNHWGFTTTPIKGEIRSGRNKEKFGRLIENRKKIHHIKACRETKLFSYLINHRAFLSSWTFWVRTKIVTTEMFFFVPFLQGYRKSRTENRPWKRDKAHEKGKRNVILEAFLRSLPPKFWKLYPQDKSRKFSEFLGVCGAKNYQNPGSYRKRSFSVLHLLHPHLPR